MKADTDKLQPWQENYEAKEIIEWNEFRIQRQS